MAKITLRELKPSEIASIYPLVKQLSPYVSPTEFQKRLKTMLPLGYRAVAAFEGTRMVGISGFWVGMRFWCGKQFDIDNFVVDKTYRGGGVGEKLVAWLEKTAQREQCQLMVLDAYVHNMMAHRFYHKMGFNITGYHYTKVPGSREPYQAKSPF